MQRVNVGHKALADYNSLIGRTMAEEIRLLAEPLRGKRMLHLSATAFGGGVAEIQYTLIPLLIDAGIDAEWRVIHGREEFYDVTKTIHNALQGDPRTLTDDQKAIFDGYNKLNADALTDVDDWDVIVVHDPQPVAVPEFVTAERPRWVWRCHIDLSTPNQDVLDFVAPRLAAYDACIFHMPAYVPRAAGLQEAVIWPPAIDPLAPKNMALAPEDAAYIVDQFGVDVERPLLLQVSRFDPWKDPLGVIDAYRMVKADHPGMQLALVGSMAHDDPEGWEYWNRTQEYCNEDPDIFMFSNLNNVGAVEVNAFQVQAAVCIQKSIREGFGLTVSEALWKGRPTIGGNVGGIVAQIADGETGYLVSSAEECARRALEILADPPATRAMTRRAKEHVRRRFLTPRLLRDWLALMHRMAGEQVELEVVAGA
ncbi:MAG TPA: glycosyltransferase [Gaiellales bacterium]|jgi:trehalose synthase|nr:glycosyltransferase [Gaiellales bacterium]